MPYWRLSSFYFFYFGLLGCISPYWGLYLDSQGMSAFQIGQLVALFGATRIVAPMLWGMLADRTTKSLWLLRFGSGLCALSFINIFWVNGFVGLAIVVVLYSFFWSAVLPQFEVITLNYLNGKMGKYSRIRLWGSIGFIVMVWGLGFVFDQISVATLPVFMLVLLCSVFVCSLSLEEPEKLHSKQAVDTSVWGVFFKTEVVVFMVASFLMQVSHGAYYTFFSLYLEQYGYSNSTIGILWALGVMAEVLIFIYMSAISKRTSMKGLLVVSLLIAAIRWYFTGHWVDSIFLLVVLQLCHAATFGSMHAVSMHYVHQFFYGPHQGKGQSLYSGLAYGAGSAAGAFLAGVAWGEWGPIRMFEISALAALLGALLVIVFIRK